MLSTSFRNTLLTATAITAGVMLAGPAFADTEASVNLSGEVTTTLSLTSVPITATTTALPLSGSAHILQISDLVMHTNNEQGYTLTASQGSLTKVGGTAIPFQVVVVADDADAPVAGDFTEASGNDYTYATAAANAALTGARDLYILYTPAALQDPGIYEGTVTLEVADK